MKRVLVHLSVAALCAAASSPALSQSARVYICTDSSDGNQFRLMVGPGVFRNTGQDGSWNDNACTASDYSCTVRGSTFVGSMDGDVEFQLDMNNGKYWWDLSFAGVSQGTCRSV